MCENNAILSAKHYQKAMLMLEKKDLLEFMANISIAIELSDDKELLAKATYLKVAGLSKLCQFNKALSSITLAEQYNSGDDLIKLRIYEGTNYCYIGEVSHAEAVFKSLLELDVNRKYIADICLPLVELQLAFKSEPDLEKAKYYLDLMNAHFAELPDHHKWRVLNEYSIYYSNLKEYNKAFELLQEALAYCEEKFLPIIYVSLAEICLKLDEYGLTVKVTEYLDRAEYLAGKFQDDVIMGNVFYTRAMIELREDQRIRALDTLYLSFEFYRKAKDHVKACDVAVKMTELMNDYQIQTLQKLKDTIGRSNHYSVSYQNDVEVMYV